MTTALVEHPRTVEGAAPPRVVAAPAPALTARGDRRFRPDIQGLRAIAVLLVVLYHAGVPGLPGGFVGVDVFFVISGFLITRQLVTESGATNRISLSYFYARRIRRLLPSALLVILVTVVIARLWGPALQATSVARDGLFASLYSINFWLAIEGVDYQHASAAVSPLQHFWSLAVEEQFYIVWPVVLLLITLVTRRRLRRMRTAAFAVVIAAIGVTSFWQSITVTKSDAPLAYFSLQTRGWELAVGALIAIAIPLLRRVPGALAAVASWTGLALILYSAVTFSDATPFPGTLAGIPVLGAALIITAGLVERRGSVELLLRPRGMQFLGTVSYGWYLWHWPAIILAPYLFATAFGWPENLEACFLALWFAVISYLVLERLSVHHVISRKRWFAVGGSLTAGVVVITLGLSLVQPASLAGLGSPVSTLGRHLTTASLAATVRASVDTFRLPANVEPTLANASADTPITTRDGCHLGFAQTHHLPCVFGDTAANRTILLFGDSHAEQWFGALNELATREHWRLVSWTKAACPVSDVELPNPQLKRKYTECGTWRADTLRDIKTMHPQLIVTSQADTLAGPEFSSSTWASETEKTVAALKRSAGRVVFLGDTPHPTRDIPTCLASHEATVSACDVLGYSSSSNTYLATRRADVATDVAKLGVPVIDPTRWFCTDVECPAVIANTIVYRDDSHMTQHYSTDLEPVLRTALARYLKEARS